MVMVALRPAPVAVMVADSFLVTRDTRTWNVTDVAPAGTLTVAGTRTLDLFDRNRMTVPFVAAVARFTRPVPTVLLVRTLGDTSSHMAPGTIRTTVLSLVVPRVAVIVTS